MIATIITHRRTVSAIQNRFLDRVRTRAGSDCWVVDKPTNFVKFTMPGGQIQIRRAGYSLWFGPLDEDDRLVATCGDPFCARPHHMRVIARREACGYRNAYREAA